MRHVDGHVEAVHRAVRRVVVDREIRRVRNTNPALEQPHLRRGLAHVIAVQVDSLALRARADERADLPLELLQVELAVFRGDRVVPVRVEERHDEQRDAYRADPGGARRAGRARARGSPLCLRPRRDECRRARARPGVRRDEPPRASDAVLREHEQRRSRPPGDVPKCWTCRRRSLRDSRARRNAHEVFVERGLGKGAGFGAREQHGRFVARSGARMNVASAGVEDDVIGFFVPRMRALSVDEPAPLLAAPRELDFWDRDRRRGLHDHPRDLRRFFADAVAVDRADLGKVDAPARAGHGLGRGRRAPRPEHDEDRDVQSRVAARLVSHRVDHAERERRRGQARDVLLPDPRLHDVPLRLRFSRPTQQRPQPPADGRGLQAHGA